MFVDEGNRYLVRGDVAFAQSIVETGWFNFPDSGIVKPQNNNFGGIGACDTCGNGNQFASALSGVRAQIQLLRNYADVNSRASTLPDPPVPELWGSTPATAASNFDHFFAKGHAPLWNSMGNGNWAGAPDYAPVVLRIYNDMLISSGQPGQCPPDVLLFGPLTEVGPVSGRVAPAGPSRSRRRRRGGFYVLSGDGNVSAYNGAPALGHPDLRMGPRARHRGDARRQRVRRAHRDRDRAQVRVRGRSRRSSGRSASRTRRGTTSRGRSRSRPTARGYVVLLADGTVSKWGTAATGPLAALPHPVFGADDARSIAVMPDGAGYLVLDRLGGVCEVRHRHAGPDRRGEHARSSASTWRATSCCFGPFGYYVLDGWGGIWASQSLPARRNPRGVLFADRWRGVTIIGGQPVAVRNDGTAAPAWADYSSLAARRVPASRQTRSWRATRSLALRRSIAAHCIASDRPTGRRRSGAPRRAPSCGTRPPPRRARWSR